MGHMTMVGNTAHLPYHHFSYHHTTIGTTTTMVPCWCHHCATTTPLGFPPLHTTRMVQCDLDNDGLCHHCMMIRCPRLYHYHNAIAMTMTTFWSCPPPHPWALLTVYDTTSQQQQWQHALGHAITIAKWWWWWHHPCHWNGDDDVSSPPPPPLLLQQGQWHGGTTHATETMTIMMMPCHHHHHHYYFSDNDNDMVVPSMPPKQQQQCCVTTTTMSMTTAW